MHAQNGIFDSLFSIPALLNPMINKMAHEASAICSHEVWVKVTYDWSTALCLWRINKWITVKRANCFATLLLLEKRSCAFYHPRSWLQQIRVAAGCVNNDFSLDKITQESCHTRYSRHLLQNNRLEVIKPNYSWNLPHLPLLCRKLWTSRKNLSPQQKTQWQLLLLEPAKTGK